MKKFVFSGVCWGYIFGPIGVGGYVWVSIVGLVGLHLGVHCVNQALFGKNDFIFSFFFVGDTGPRRYSYNKSDTLLHIAASTGRLDIYKKLLKFSHERNPRAEDGRTPLHHACKNGHLNIVEFLLPNLMDKSPRTILGNY